MLSRYARVAGIAAAAAAVIWVMGYGYWRFHVSNNLSAVEGQAQQAGAGGLAFTVPPETLADLQKSGDRALPFIAEALQKSDQSPPYLAAISSFFVDRLMRVMPMPNPEDLKIIPADTPEVRQSKCDALRSIWNQVGVNRFRWWKWWTDQGLE